MVWWTVHKLLRHARLLLVLSLGVGCHQAVTSVPAGGVPRPSAAKPDRVSVLPRTEAALEAALNNELKGLPHDTIAFVATGRERSDPPPELLTRLRHGHPNLKPASEARYPKAGERASPGRYRGVEDRVIGERASVYSATVIGWESARKVRVNVSPVR